MKTTEEIFSKAKQLHQSNKIKEAQKLYKKLTAHNKNNFQLFFLLGTSFLQTKNYSEAINYLESSIKINPNFEDAYNNVGIALAEKKNYQKAIYNYDKALKLKPNFFHALLNKGIALKNIHQYENAIKFLNLAKDIDPKKPEIYNTLGNVFKEQAYYDKAIKSYDMAIKISSDYADAYNNKGIVLNLMEKYEESFQNYKMALSINPDNDYILGGVIHSKMHLCDWQNLENSIFNLKNKIIDKNLVAGPFILLSIFDDLKIQKLNAENHIKKNFHEYKLSNIKPSSLKNNKNIRIGYYSGEFHKHPCLLLMKDIYKYHDKSRFEIYAFSYGPNPRSNPLRDEVKPYFKTFFDISQKSDEEIINLSKDLNIDIAVNLTGLANYERTSMFAKRVAPIQLNYLGFPGTMGAKFMDYIIADNLIIPDKMKKYYTEKVIYLPNCYQPNTNKLLDTSIKKKINRKNLGLPENGMVFCCFNNHYKITPYIFNAWMNILKKVDKSVMWIYVDKKYAQENLRKEAIVRNVDPNRIRFAQKENIENHLVRMKFADLFLDTWPYNAHTTASDSIRMGLPLLTLMGNSFASRVASSLLNTINVPELITTKIDDYENLAIKLGNDKSKLDEIKNKIKTNSKKSSLYDSKKFTKNLENIYNKLII